MSAVRVAGVSLLIALLVTLRSENSVERAVANERVERAVRDMTVLREFMH